MLLAVLVLWTAGVTGCSPSSPEGSSWVESPDPGPLAAVRIVRRYENGFIEEISEGFSSTWDPDISFDARRVLFAGKRDPGSPEGIHERDLDSGRVKTHFEAPGRISCPRYGPGNSLIFLWNRHPSPGSEAGGILYNLLPDTPPDRITFSVGLTFDPVVLPDGLIVFGIENQPGLWSVNWDGTEVASYTEFHSADGSPGGLSLRPLISDPSREILFARGIPGNELFEIDLRSHHYGITRSSSAIPPDGRRKLEPHAKVFYQPSLVKPGVTESELFCVDSRLTDLPPSQPADTARTVRVRIDPAESNGDVPQEPGSTFDSNVQPDGSFYLTVPPDRGLSFDLIGSSGNVLRSMTSRMWLRPGEKRGCIGCHERRAQAPPNRVIMALEIPPERWNP